MTKVIVANDLVGLGKVALTSSLPIMSACQTEVLPLPTVLLSSHTGDFNNIYVRDLTDDLKGFCKQWEHLDFKVDGLVSGYFKSEEELKQRLNNHFPNLHFYCRLFFYYGEKILYAQR